jgi:hypothetical protein
MLELKDKALDSISGGWGSKKIKITIDNKNYADIDVKHIMLGKGSTFIINVSQSIG